MHTAALVSVDIDSGLKLLDILDKANLKVGVALWACLAEYEDWRLILSAKEFDSHTLMDAYGLMHKALDDAKFPQAKTPVVMIVPRTETFVKQLRKYFAKTSSVEGMRLGGQMFGDRFILDAYVYRVR